MRKKAIQYLKVLSISFLVALAGCMVMKESPLFEKLLSPKPPIYEKRPIKFSHVTHAEKEDLECKNCHVKFDDSRQAGMPSIRLCRNCHDTKEEIDKYLRPFLVDKKIRWTDVTALSEDAIFSHQTHYEANVDCIQCHQGIEKSEFVSRKLRNEKDDCIRCHADEDIRGDCEVCHQSVDREWEPASHERNWRRYHGQEARAKIVPPYENRCSMCHSQSECQKCHRDEKPRDHTAFFRVRGHGVAAEMDRSRCQTCHRTDYCDRCHRETEPASHRRGTWGAPRDRHCMTCHVPLRGKGCSVCHEGTPSHQAADPLPDNITHLTASEAACRTCHSAGLRHFDNGDRCRACHR